MDDDPSKAGGRDHARSGAETARPGGSGEPINAREESPGSEGNPGHETTKAEARRWLLAVAIRVVLAGTVVIVLYWLVPLEWFDENWSAFAVLAIGLIGYMVLVLTRMRHLRYSPRPMIELGESLVLVVITLVTLFAFTYVVLSRNLEGAFNVDLDKHSALYFSMTVTTTTGFGDIVAKATIVRDVVTFQMFVTLLVLAVAIRGVTAAAQYAHKKSPSRSSSER